MKKKVPPCEFRMGAQTLSCSVSAAWWSMDYNQGTAFYAAASTGAETDYRLVADWFSGTAEGAHYIPTAKVS